MKKTTDAFNKTVDFTYDTANNLKTLTAANRVTSYNYDGKNQLDTVIQNSTTIANYDWYADGLLQKVDYSANKKREFTYDNADRISNITNTIGTNSESFDYGYDANSNRNSEVRKANGQAFRTIAYDYDKLDRLTKADYTATVATPNPPNNSQAVYVENTSLNNYGYDAVGNRLNETKQNSSKTITLITDNNGQTTRSEQISTSPLATTTATYDALNQLTQLNEPSGISNFGYDLNGNLLQVSKNAAIISKYEYDVRNQLTKALDGFNNELARFDYDFERNRLSKTGASGYQSYVYAGDQIISEHNAVGTATANYTIGAGEIVKSEFANGENNLHFTDALGSVTSLANATNSSLTSRNEYNAFGEVSINGNTANSIGYTGQRLDNETGLMALGNGERYYSPSYARFIQQDSYAGMPNVPQSLNRYAYAHNNPNKFTDPSGNVITPETIWDAISFGVGLSLAVDDYAAGNYSGLALDVVGLVADGISIAIPILPGGWSVAIKASRAAMTTIKMVQTIDRAVNVGQGIVSTYKNIQEGNYGWAAFSGTLTILGVGGLRSSARELNDILKVSDEVLEHQRVLSKSQDVLNAKNNPEMLQKLTQVEGKAQKADLLEELNDSHIYESADELRKLAKERVSRIETKGDELYLSNKERGAVLSVVKDRKTGEVYYGLNNSKGKEPSIFHPLLKERTDVINAKYADKPARFEAFNQNTKGVHPSEPGSHSEVYALNEALLARETQGMKVTKADLGDFDVYNIGLQDTNVFSKGGFAPRCGNCQIITEGVYMTGFDVVKRKNK